jgi:hypothetical protein
MFDLRMIARPGFSSNVEKPGFFMSAKSFDNWAI